MGENFEKLLNGYIDYLKREKPGRDEPGLDLNLDRLPFEPSET